MKCWRINQRLTIYLIFNLHNIVFNDQITFLANINDTPAYLFKNSVRFFISCVFVLIDR